MSPLFFSHYTPQNHKREMPSKHRKKGPACASPFQLISNFLLSQSVSGQVSSASMSLTTVFEMGTGGPS